MLLQSVHRTAVKGVLSIFSNLLVLKKKASKSMAETCPSNNRLLQIVINKTHVVISILTKMPQHKQGLSSNILLIVNRKADPFLQLLEYLGCL